MYSIYYNLKYLLMMIKSVLLIVLAIFASESISKTHTLRKHKRSHKHLSCGTYEMKERCEA